jgi:vancomycin resistance protein YoaR
MGCLVIARPAASAVSWRPSTPGVRRIVEQETKSKKRLTRTVWFWLLVAVGAVVAVCAIAVLVDSLVYTDEVHAGVSVYGVDLGGMTKGQATAALSRLVDSAGPVTLTSGDKTWSVKPADAGTAMGVKGAVAQAMAVTRGSNFLEDVVTRFKLYFNRRDLPLTGTVDQAKIDALLSGIATELHVTPLNADLAIQNGAIKVIEGRDQQDADTSAMGPQMESLFVTLHSGTLAVPIVVTDPPVQAEDNRAAQEQAQTMIGAPITLIDHDKQWKLTPEQIASFLDFRSETQNGVPTLVPYISQGKMWLFLQTLAPEVKTDPVNAKLASSGSSFRVIPAVNGETLDPTATVKALNATALKPAGRTVDVALIITEPDFTTAEAKATTFNDQLSTFTTTYACPANRATNVRITTKYATNVFLAPGQEYNFDRQIGPRTAARGYVLAPGITGPNTLEDVLGGGICQVSTTMFNAVFFAGLKVTERHNHSIYINHYPKGRDATVTGGGKNLRFVNDTGHYIWIRGSSNGITTTIAIYGTSDGRKVSYSVGNFYNVKSPTGTVTIKDSTLKVGTTKVSPGQTGRQLKTTRLVKATDGSVLHNDTWISTWPAYPTTIAVGTKP